MAEDVTVAIRADTQPFQDALQQLDKLSSKSAKALRTMREDRFLKIGGN